LGGGRWGWVGAGLDCLRRWFCWQVVYLRPEIPAFSFADLRFLWDDVGQEHPRRRRNQLEL